MEKYEHRFGTSVAGDLRVLPKKDVARVLKCFRVLSEDPRPPGSEKLSGRERYRYRRGRYRVIYEIRNTELVVIVVKAGPRKDGAQ